MADSRWRPEILDDVRARTMMSVSRILFMALEFGAAAALFWLGQKLWPGTQGVLVWLVASLATLGHSMARDWRKSRENLNG